MKYTVNDVMEYVREEDVKFIRLAFCDLGGNLKNLSVMPEELKRAFDRGIAFDGSAIKGFELVEKSDLFLFPDPDTLTLLPWRPSHGKVIRLFCDIKYPDGRPYELDSRRILKDAVLKAKEYNLDVEVGAEFEFYVFKTDENGEKTDIPCDNAGYMDVAPADRGENLRREICLTIEEMGLNPECSHHEEGPGQNEIDFKYSDALSSADHAVIFKNATESIAYKNGFYATFDPKPIDGEPGSGMHVNVSVKGGDDKTFSRFLAGVLRRIKDITAFLNPTESSYKRLGEKKAPKVVGWGRENRSCLVRIPATNGGEKRFELRSPDGKSNVYLVYALVIYAGIEGIKDKLTLGEETVNNAYVTGGEKLPESLKDAKKAAYESEFVNKYLPKRIVDKMK
ncbi:MAG: glutamine synthetase family protein [Clostridiales bacterium]|nr:glutamine synthetase family protein [Clostridiales bacterium]